MNASPKGMVPKNFLVGGVGKNLKNFECCLQFGASTYDLGTLANFCTLIRPWN